MPPADELELTDPRAMRALAHPARLSILELLRVNGSGTATVAQATDSACTRDSPSPPTMLIHTCSVM